MLVGAFTDNADAAFKALQPIGRHRIESSLAILVADRVVRRRETGNIKEVLMLTDTLLALFVRFLLRAEAP